MSPDFGLRKPGFVMAGSPRTTFVALGNFFGKNLKGKGKEIGLRDSFIIYEMGMIVIT